MERLLYKKDKNINKKYMVNKNKASHCLHFQKAVTRLSLFSTSFKIDLTGWNVECNQPNIIGLLGFVTVWNAPENILKKS